MNSPRPQPLYGLGFRTGCQIHFYGHSLYWVFHHMGRIKLVAETLKDGELVVYGKISLDDFERLAARTSLRGLRRHSWGLSWPFKKQECGAEDDFSGFTRWRDQLLAEANHAQSEVYEYQKITPYSTWLS